MFNFVTFILFQKCQFVNRNKVISPISFIFIFWSRDHVINVKTKENLQIYVWGKIPFVVGLLARDIANHSYA